MMIINASDWEQKIDVISDHVQYYVTYYLKNINFDLASKTETWRTRPGAFAGVWVNQANNTVLLVRDHFGLQPLYYWFEAGKLIFSENIPDILRYLDKLPALHGDQIQTLFSQFQCYRDETFYQGIYRVEPGCILQINFDGSKIRTPFWVLDPNIDALHYQNESEYAEHFAELLTQSIRFNTQDTPLIAAEFSGGIDSTAICAAAYQQGLRVPLFMHESPEGSYGANYDRSYENAFIDRFAVTEFYRINAEKFDVIQSLQHYAKQFAGACPYIFPILANNIHQAVKERGYRVLLSGFGGDQGVSGHAFNRVYLPELLQKHAYQEAWHELRAEYLFKNQMPPTTLRGLITLLKLSCPIIYHSMQTCSRFKQGFLRYWDDSMPAANKIYSDFYYNNLREFEKNLLQGRESHEIRMRIEYCSILAKQLGFEYRYPLLYPPLVDFYFRVPAKYKRKNGVGRYLMRQYLNQYFPNGIFDNNQKSAGIHIMPATRAKCEALASSGALEAHFHDLPFQHYLNQPADQWVSLIKQMYAYMFKYFWSNTTIAKY